MDHGKPRLSSSVLLNITILDVNDHSPFVASSEADESLLTNPIDLPLGQVNDKNLFIISENMPSNTYLGQLIATDKDEGLNAQLRFELITDQIYYYHKQFRLTPNGSLFTAKELDREEKVSIFI